MQFSRDNKGSLEPEFVHLHLHSAYSLAEGAIQVKDLPQLCQQSAMPALALTDSMNLFGALEFSLTCAAAGVQPIVGCEAELITAAGQGKIVLLVQNQQGYQNLLWLISNAYLRLSAGSVPCLTLADLQHSAAGLIALTGGVAGILGQVLLKNNDLPAGGQLCQDLQALFPHRLYIELERHGLEAESQLEPYFLELAQQYALPLVATNNVYFAAPELYEAHDVLLCIAEGTTIGNPTRRQVTVEHYFKTPAAMKELFADIPEAIANSVAIARRCGFMPTSQPPILPSFKTASGRSEKEELRLQAQEGLRHRLRQSVEPSLREPIPEPYQKRLNEELAILESMGFSGYFLIVADFIQWAKRQKIPVGPGRGSGAGSLVAWALTITDLDPIKFNLIFERFLNPERLSLPDFDVDFCQDRRDEVIHYVAEKYGRDCVAHIITFGKLQARAALRDVGRVLEMSYTRVDQICKLIPHSPTNPLGIAQALEVEPSLRQMRADDPQVAQLIEISMQLEGLYRHASTHAAGLVIGGQPLVEIIPLYKDERSALSVTQFSMKYVELAGLLKFDFLGLRTLTVIAKCCEMLQQRGVALDIIAIPLDDQKTYELLTRVEAVGVFQVESAGMRDVLRRLRPDRFEDLIALVALYRPGPMDDIPRYLACKHGEEEITYLHPKLQSILEPTYGVMVYQEQVMQIAQVLGGYSLGAADSLRRAMGKKIKTEMAAQRTRFIDGAIAGGIDKASATQIFEAMAKFASYGFNKSHSAPYALLTYQTAYLKANYPLEFFAASMSCELNDTAKLITFRQDLERLGIPLYPPCVNASFADFAVEKAGVRYALAAIKNVGEQAMQSLVDERQKNGEFKSLEDLAARLDTKVLNKRQLEGLIMAGALDCLHNNRQQLFTGVEAILKYAQTVIWEKKSLQQSLFAKIPLPPINIKLPACEEWEALTKINYELQAVGFFLTEHPLSIYRHSLLHLQAQVKITKAAALAELQEGTYYLVGVVLSKQERTSRNGQKFAFVQISDLTGLYEVAVFAEVFAKKRTLLQTGKMLFLEVIARRDGNSVRLTAQDITLLETVLAGTTKAFIIEVNTGVDMQQLKDLFLGLPPGDTKVQFHITLPGNGPPTILTLPNSYSLYEDTWQKLAGINGTRLLS